MIGFIANLFTYTTFAVWILAGAFLLAGNMKKKEGFRKGAFTGALAVIVMSVLLCMVKSLIPERGLFFFVFSRSLLYSIILFMTVYLMKQLYEEPAGALLSTVAASYALEHLYSQLVLSLFVLIGREDLLMFLLSTACRAVVYILIDRIWKKKGAGVNAGLIPGKEGTELYLCSVIFLLVVSLFRDYYVEESLALNLCSRVFSGSVSMFMLMVYGGYLEKSELEEKMELSQQLSSQQLKQYEMEKMNLDLIHVKTHDLKKLVSDAEGNAVQLSEAEKKEILQSVSISEASFHTGNEVLDVILNQRALRCEEEHIAFSCMADGSLISFMSSMDIYAVFANALDNAIEAVLRISDGRPKAVTMRLNRRMGMAVLNIENSYDPQTVKIGQDGFATSKEDSDYHGYGLRSIRMIAEKYDGQMIVSPDAENGMFRLTVLLTEHDAKN